MYLYNKDTDSLRLISISISGGQSTGSSKYPSISKDGTTIAYVSSASDIISEDSNSSYDLFKVRVR